MKLENIKTLDIEKVETRMLEIREMNLDDLDVENIEAITKEVEALEARKKEIENDVKAKKELRSKIANGTIEGKQIKKEEEERKMELTKENVLMSAEYRSAFLKSLQGKELNDVEHRALAMTDAKAVIPTELQNEIIKKAKEYAPVLNEINLLNVNGNVTFAVEGEVTEADVHAENASITAKKDTFVSVSLTTYEITKLVQISASVKSMAIAAFESWLVDNLSQAVAMKIEKLVFNGTGTGEAKGIDTITWNAKNSVEVANASTLTAQNVYALHGLLKTGYARGAKMFMNRLTLFTDFLPLQDKAKNDLVHLVGDKYYCLGVEIVLTDSIKDHEAILGNMKKYVANMAEAMNVISGFDIDTNSYKYLGVAQFDGKPAIEEAFVKLKKASV